MYEIYTLPSDQRLPFKALTNEADWQTDRDILITGQTHLNATNAYALWTKTKYFFLKKSFILRSVADPAGPGRRLLRLRLAGRPRLGGQEGFGWVHHQGKGPGAGEGAAPREGQQQESELGTLMLDSFNRLLWGFPWYAGDRMELSRVSVGTVGPPKIIGPYLACNVALSPQRSDNLNWWTVDF